MPAFPQNGQPGWARTTNFVAVMMGGTSGIGAATSLELAKRCQQVTIYIVGRNDVRGARVVEQIHSLNHRAKAHYIRSDLTLLRNVDDVCKQVSERESEINLLLLTAGFLSLSGRDETTEGIDKMYCLQYFSRMRAITSLLPLLENASNGPRLSRVISILGAGNEGHIFEDDIELKSNYSLKSCSGQAICMTSLAFERLARDHKDIEFIHVYPGPVRGTNIMAGMGKFAYHVSQTLMAIAAPLITSLDRCAAIQAHIALTDFAELNSPRGENQTKLSCLRLGPGGQPCQENAVLRRYIEHGWTERVWKHTEAMFTRALDNKKA